MPAGTAHPKAAAQPCAPAAPLQHVAHSRRTAATPSSSTLSQILRDRPAPHKTPPPDSHLHQLGELADDCDDAEHVQPLPQLLHQELELHHILSTQQHAQGLPLHREGLAGGRLLPGHQLPACRRAWGQQASSAMRHALHAQLGTVWPLPLCMRAHEGDHLSAPT
ncbi:MAG: hypothetical protein WDW38_005077 [Sanguina aurantia]